MLDFPLYQLMEEIINGTTETTWSLEFIEVRYIGEWCVVDYNDKGYPCIIIKV